MFLWNYRTFLKELTSICCLLALELVFWLSHLSSWKRFNVWSKYSRGEVHLLYGQHKKLVWWNIFGIHVTRWTLWNWWIIEGTSKVHWFLSRGPIGPNDYDQGSRCFKNIWFPVFPICKHLLTLKCITPNGSHSFLIHYADSTWCLYTFRPPWYWGRVPRTPLLMLVSHLSHPSGCHINTMTYPI